MPFDTSVVDPGQFSFCFKVADDEEFAVFNMKPFEGSCSAWAGLIIRLNVTRESSGSVITLQGCCADVSAMSPQFLPTALDDRAHNFGIHQGGQPALDTFSTSIGSFPQEYASESGNLHWPLPYSQQHDPSQHASFGTLPSNSSCPDISNALLSHDALDALEMALSWTGLSSEYDTLSDITSSPLSTSASTPSSIDTSEFDLVGQSPEAGSPSEVLPGPSPTANETNGTTVHVSEPDSKRRARRLRPYSCTHPGCDRKFTSEYTRRVHLEAHKPKVREALPCMMGCGEMFSRRHDRLRHQVIQHGQVCEWSCKKCRKFFSSSKMLENHKCPGVAKPGARWIQNQNQSTTRI